MILNTRNVDRFVLETKEGFLNLQSREWRRMSKEKGPEQIWVRTNEGSGESPFQIDLNFFNKCRK